MKPLMLQTASKLDPMICAVSVLSVYNISLRVPGAGYDLLFYCCSAEATIYANIHMVV